MATARAQRLLWIIGTVYVALFRLNLGLLSDYKICGDSECESLMSRVQALRDHYSKDCRFLSFRRGDTIFVYHKLTGKREDLWAGSIDKQFGYFPKDVVQEEQVYATLEKVVETQKSDFFCMDEFGYPIDSTHLDSDGDENDDSDQTIGTQESETTQLSPHSDNTNVESPAAPSTQSPLSAKEEEGGENINVGDATAGAHEEAHEAPGSHSEQGGSPSSSWLGSSVTGWLGMANEDHHGSLAEGEREDKRQETQAETSLTSSVTGWLGFGGEGKPDDAKQSVKIKEEPADSFTSSMTGWLGFQSEEKTDSANKEQDKERKTDEQTEPEERFRSRRMSLDLEGSELHEEEKKEMGTLGWLGSGLSSTLGFGLTNQESGQKTSGEEETEKEKEQPASSSWLDMEIGGILGFRKDNIEVEESAGSSFKETENALQQLTQSQSADTSQQQSALIDSVKTENSNESQLEETPKSSSIEEDSADSNVVSHTKFEKQSQVVGGMSSMINGLFQRGDTEEKEDNNKKEIENEDHQIHKFLLNEHKDHNRDREEEMKTASDIDQGVTTQSAIDVGLDHSSVNLNPQVKDDEKDQLQSKNTKSMEEKEAELVNQGTGVKPGVSGDNHEEEGGNEETELPHRGVFMTQTEESREESEVSGEIEDSSGQSQLFSSSPADRDKPDLVEDDSFIPHRTETNGDEAYQMEHMVTQSDNDADKQEESVEGTVTDENYLQQAHTETETSGSKEEILNKNELTSITGSDTEEEEDSKQEITEKNEDKKADDLKEIEEVKHEGKQEDLGKLNEKRKREVEEIKKEDVEEENQGDLEELNGEEKQEDVNEMIEEGEQEELGERTEEKKIDKFEEVEERTEEEKQQKAKEENQDEAAGVMEEENQQEVNKIKEKVEEELEEFKEEEEKNEEGKQEEVEEIKEQEKQVENTELKEEKLKEGDLNEEEEKERWRDVEEVQEELNEFEEKNREEEEQLQSSDLEIQLEKIQDEGDDEKKQREVKEVKDEKMAMGLVIDRDGGGSEEGVSSASSGSDETGKQNDHTGRTGEKLEIHSEGKTSNDASNLEENMSEGRWEISHPSSYDPVKSQAVRFEQTAAQVSEDPTGSSLPSDDQGTGTATGGAFGLFKNALGFFSQTPTTETEQSAESAQGLITNPDETSQPPEQELETTTLPSPVEDVHTDLPTEQPQPHSPSPEIHPHTAPPNTEVHLQTRTLFKHYKNLLAHMSTDEATILLELFGQHKLQFLDYILIASDDVSADPDNDQSILLDIQRLLHYHRETLVAPRVRLPDAPQEDKEKTRTLITLQKLEMLLERVRETFNTGKTDDSNQQAEASCARASCSTHSKNKEVNTDEESKKTKDSSVAQEDIRKEEGTTVEKDKGQVGDGVGTKRETVDEKSEEKANGEERASLPYVQPGSPHLQEGIMKQILDMVHLMAEDSTTHAQAVRELLRCLTMQR